MAAKKKPKSKKSGEIKSPEAIPPLKSKYIGQKYYKTANGEKPAQQYLNGLDMSAAVRMYTQLDRLKAGNTGHGHAVRGGVFELIVDDGPGYRMYYTIVDDQTVILLLAGGTKKNQKEDIDQAELYKKDYEARKKAGTYVD